MSTDIVDVNIDEIVIAKRPRLDDGDLTVLENSIRSIGLLHPVVLDRHNVLVAGGRRLQACRNLGHRTIAARRLDIKAGSPEALDVQTDENLCRRELTPEEMNTLVDAKRQASGAHSPLGDIKNFFAGMRERFREHGKS